MNFLFILSYSLCDARVGREALLLFLASKYIQQSVKLLLFSNRSYLPLLHTGAF